LSKLNRFEFSVKGRARTRGVAL